MALTGDKALSGSIRMTNRTWPVLNWRFPFKSREFQIKLLVGSLVMNFVLGLGVWWYSVERPCEDAAQLAEVASRLANLDREVAVSGFSGNPQSGIGERRSVLLAEVAPALMRLGDHADAELVGIILNAYQQQGDYARAIQFGTVIAESPATPLTLRLNTYRFLGHAYLNEVGGSISEVGRSFAAALDLIQDNDDPKSKAVAAAINMDWGNVLVQAGRVEDGFNRLVLGRQNAVGLVCEFPDRSRLIAMASENLSSLTAIDIAWADRLQKAIASDPDLCGR